MDKFITVDEAVAKIKSGMTLMIGGFLAAGTPNKIVEALSKTDVKDLTIIANDTAYPDKGIGLLITNKQVKKVIASHIGTNPNTIQQLNDKELIVEFSPQGTLAERIRCGGAGLGGVLTPTGIGTVVEEGKQKLTIDGKEYLLEKPLHADIALIGANIADETGNLIYKGTTQNFNPMMATAADLVIAEAQEVVKTGEIPMENVHTPGIYVNFIVK
jgi:acetate CoA/acetoacetate CoA-transferase alpha subunit